MRKSDRKEKMRKGFTVLRNIGAICLFCSVCWYLLDSFMINFWQRLRVFSSDPAFFDHGISKTPYIAVVISGLTFLACGIMADINNKIE